MEDDEGLRRRLEEKRRPHREHWLYRQAAPVSDAVRALVSQPQFARKYALRDLIAAWAAVGGAEIALHSEVAGVRKGVMMVVVDSAACLHELANFRRKELLARLTEHKGCGKIRDIEFQLGALEREGK